MKSAEERRGLARKYNDRYRRSHREEVAARKKSYYERHKKELDAYGKSKYKMMREAWLSLTDEERAQIIEEKRKELMEKYNEKK